jgi:hypothetical protein
MAIAKAPSVRSNHDCMIQRTFHDLVDDQAPTFIS